MESENKTNIHKFDITDKMLNESLEDIYYEIESLYYLCHIFTDKIIFNIEKMRRFTMMITNNKKALKL